RRWRYVRTGTTRPATISATSAACASAARRPARRPRPAVTAPPEVLRAAGPLPAPPPPMSPAPTAAPPGPASSARPAGTTSPAAAGAPSMSSFPYPQATWTAVVGADRAYYERVQAVTGPEGAAVTFPSYYAERRFQLVGNQMRIGRRSVSRGLAPEIDLTGPP